MKSYKIEGHEVREINSSDGSFYYYLVSAGMKNRRKWVCPVFCKDEGRVVELTFSTLKEAREGLKMFGHSYSKAI